MIRLPFLLFGIVLLGVTLACSKDKASPSSTSKVGTLGEPIGAELAATPKLPALSIAFAVTKGADPVPMLSSLVTAVTQSIVGCPDFVTEARKSQSDVIAVDFTVEQGKIKPAPRPASEATAGRECLSKALDGKQLAAADSPKLDGRTEIKVTP